MARRTLSQIRKTSHKRMKWTTTVEPTRRRMDRQQATDPAKCTPALLSLKSLILLQSTHWTKPITLLIQLPVKGESPRYGSRLGTRSMPPQYPVASITQHTAIRSVQLLKLITAPKIVQRRQQGRLGCDQGGHSGSSRHLCGESKQRL